jgi:hypothetical protein
METTGDVIAFTDEAGRRGYVRDLSASSDQLVSLMVSILIPIEHLEAMRALFQPPFDRFRAAAPPGAKLHITEAFKSGHETWRAVAEQVRAEQFQLMKQDGVFLTYSARRMRVSRELHDLLECLTAQAKAQRRTDYVIPGENRPSAAQVDDDVMINLALMADEFAEVRKRGKVQFYFDQIDEAVKKRYLEAIGITQRTSGEEQQITARDRQTTERVYGQLQIKAHAPMPLNTTHLGTINVVGKIDPLTFLADVVCNHLYRHLESLPPDTPLNEAPSLQSWELRELTWVAPADSMFDKI